MIYFDNSATTLQKPPAVAEATAWAIDHLGNAGRSAYPAAMDAARSLHTARGLVAGLVGLQNERQVAFTSGATESLNLIAQALVQPGNHVVTTVLEHNSVLRPLYHAGCRLDFLECDDEGNLLVNQLPSLLTPDTKYMFVTHGSNVLGTLTDVAALYDTCRAHGVVLVLDAAQTMGQVPLRADMADIICFTGHKALYGPQGTGGIIARPGLTLRVNKTGGTGADAFAENQGTEMPGVFEAGSPNVHALHGLSQGISFVHKTGIKAIADKEAALTARFIGGLQGLSGLRLYGPSHGPRLPVVALNFAGLPSEEVSLRLWEHYGIATRPGSHCAPLLHNRFGTQGSGMVRFSFSWYNTFKEIDATVAALKEIAHG